MITSAHFPKRVSETILASDSATHKQEKNRRIKHLGRNERPMLPIHRIWVSYYSITFSEGNFVQRRTARWHQKKTGELNNVPHASTQQNCPKSKAKQAPGRNYQGMGNLSVAGKGLGISFCKLHKRENNIRKRLASNLNPTSLQNRRKLIHWSMFITLYSCWFCRVYAQTNHSGG